MSSSSFPHFCSSFQKKSLNLSKVTIHSLCWKSCKDPMCHLVLKNKWLRQAQTRFETPQFHKPPQLNQTLVIITFCSVVFLISVRNYSENFFNTRKECFLLLKPFELAFFLYLWKKCVFLSCNSIDWIVLCQMPKHICSSAYEYQK